jgi:hypothetical protein
VAPYSIFGHIEIAALRVHLGAYGRHDQTLDSAPRRFRQARALVERSGARPAAPVREDDPEGLSPTRYGDFTRKGIAWDF